MSNLIAFALSAALAGGITGILLAIGGAKLGGPR